MIYKKKDIRENIKTYGRKFTDEVVTFDTQKIVFKRCLFKISKEEAFNYSFMAFAELKTEKSIKEFLCFPKEKVILVEVA